MEKSKYEKPVARNLDAVQPVQGTCWSGNIEYTVTGPCENGATALPPCNSGSIILEWIGCSIGSAAALSCTSGTSAS